MPLTQVKREPGRAWVDRRAAKVVEDLLSATIVTMTRKFSKSRGLEGDGLAGHDDVYAVVHKALLEAVALGKSGKTEGVQCR